MLTSEEVKKNRELQGGIPNVFFVNFSEDLFNISKLWTDYLPALFMLIFGLLILLVGIIADGSTCYRVGCFILISVSGLMVAAYLLALFSEFLRARSINTTWPVGKKVTVKRDSKVMTIERRGLVIGDEVLLKDGHRVPADILIRSTIGKGSYIQADENLIGYSLENKNVCVITSPVFLKDIYYYDFVLYAGTVLRTDYDYIAGEVHSVGNDTVSWKIFHEGLKFVEK